MSGRNDGRDAWVLEGILYTIVDDNYVVSEKSKDWMAWIAPEKVCARLWHQTENLGSAFWLYPYQKGDGDFRFRMVKKEDFCSLYSLKKAKKKFDKTTDKIIADKSLNTCDRQRRLERRRCWRFCHGYQCFEQVEIKGVQPNRRPISYPFYGSAYQIISGAQLHNLNDPALKPQSSYICITQGKILLIYDTDSMIVTQMLKLIEDRDVIATAIVFDYQLGYFVVLVFDVSTESLV